MDSISDSEDDGGPLSVGDISRIRLKSSLQSLTPTDHQIITSYLLQSKYALLLKENEDEEEVNGNDGRDAVVVDSISQKNDDDLQLLEMYVDRSHELRSRRSLRKRNFASTHPYLADQAHWLGLCSPNYLNDIYKDEQDVKKIVLFLNKLYASKKQRYPKEDKYKAKSFYAHLGKAALQYRLEMEDEDEVESYVQEEEEEEEEETQLGNVHSDADADNDADFDFEMPVDEEDINNARGGDVSGKTVRSAVRSRNIVLDDDDDDDSSSEDDQEYILVGGRRRKLKLILRGVLPETAKRMNLFSSQEPKKRPDKHFHHHHQQPIRQGVAIKKVSKNKGKTYHSIDEFRDFIDDASSSRIQDIVDPPTPLYGSSSSNDSDDSLIIVEESNNNNGDSDSDIRESDYIDPLFSGIRAKTKQNNKYKQKKKMYKQSTLGTTTIRRKRHKSATAVSSSLIPSTRKRTTSSSSRGLPRRRISSKVSAPTKVRNKYISNSLFPTSFPIDRYYIRRPPNIFTTVLEAESKKRYLESKMIQEQRSRPLTMVNFNAEILDGPIDIPSSVFPQDYILNAIKFPDLERLSEGEPLLDLQREDSITITYNANSYFLSLIDKGTSFRHMEKIINQMASSIKENKLNATAFYASVRGLLLWNMVSQEPPKHRIIRSLKVLILIMFKHCKESRRLDLFHLIPYPIFMLFQCLMLQRRHSLNDYELLKLLKTYSSVYWSIFFQYFNDILELEDIYPNKVSKENEALVIMKLINQHDWWTPIETAIESLPKTIDLFDTLDLLYFLACYYSNSRSNWRCFMVLYERISMLLLLLIHNHFMEIVISLIETKGWTLNDGLMSLLFSTITKRRFTNFEDERSAHLIGFVHSRQDILPDTFMNGFLFLLYSYISDLPVEGNNHKRSIVKFMVSGSVVSATASEGLKVKKQVLINRLNHVLILLQLSSFDLQSAFTDILGSILDGSDIELDKLVFLAIQTYVEIVDTRARRRPLTVLKEFLQIVIEHYGSVLEATKLWKVVIKYYQETLTSQESVKVIERLTLTKDTTILLGITSWTLKSVLLSITVTQSNVYRKLVTKFLAVLHLEMVSMDYRKSPQLVEQLINVIVRLEYVANDRNWSVLVFQKFQFLGNPALREEYSLYFYYQVLDYWGLDNLIDNILISLLQALARNRHNHYLIMLWSRLTNSGSPLFVSQTYRDDHQSREQIAETLLTNLNDTREMTDNAKTNYFHELLVQMNNEFDVYYQSRPFKLYYKSIIRTLQNHCRQFIANEMAFKSLVEKLGILEIELRKYDVIKSPLRDQLEQVHSALVNSIHFQRDYTLELKKWVFYENFTVVFQLVDIYIRSLKESSSSSNQDRLWVYLIFMIRFILVGFMEMKIPFSTMEFMGFVEILSTVPSIDSCSPYQNQFVEFSVDIFNEALVATTGYFEYNLVVEAFNRFNDKALDPVPPPKLTNIPIHHLQQNIPRLCYH
ncbi:uncharacterized protein KQ657_003058 [Scheffersomyces spartinae]|uniref:Uncharacterized protein n=1 Tax=Scheffersomyces spartinae TaxID=45513 RepID=A0A9P7V5B5_9ASCO|nr:uncharacterized protein KQ657_003058 [Scheffersomyces spartinae]KAG7191552.1 hypothetical protein KQ657_003058 [Scheffersomyces spartinae]